jgi:hypothetical protein
MPCSLSFCFWENTLQIALKILLCIIFRALQKRKISYFGRCARNRCWGKHSKASCWYGKKLLKRMVRHGKVRQKEKMLIRGVSWAGYRVGPMGDRTEIHTSVFTPEVRKLGYLLSPTSDPHGLGSVWRLSVCEI